MKQEYTLVLVIGLFLSAYVLEAIIDPLTLELATPYHYINPEFLKTYPFTSTVIAVRSLALFLSITWLMSFIENKFGLKAIISLVIAALTQLYVLQDMALGGRILPTEWSLSIAYGGLFMIAAILYYIVKGFIHAAHQKLTKKEEVNSDHSQE